MNDQTHEMKVTVVDIQMPFGSMVRFMVKAVLAAIPALLILSIIGGIVSFVFYAILLHGAQG